MTLAETVAAIQARASYITCFTDAAPADGWLPCAALIADPAFLRAEIEATAAGRGTDDTQVLTSVFVQSYAFRLASVAVAAYALGLPGPSVHPSVNAVRITRNRPGQLAVTDPAIALAEPGELAAALLEHHMRPLIDAVRATTRVGERMLWGNTAASIATVFRAVHGGDPSVRERAAAFDAAAAPWLAGHGGYSTIETPDALGWYWNRTNCCLWYRSSSGGWCDDCSLTDPAERDARRRADLLPEGTPG